MGTLWCWCVFTSPRLEVGDEAEYEAERIGLLRI